MECHKLHVSRAYELSCLTCSTFLTYYASLTCPHALRGKYLLRALCALTRYVPCLPSCLTYLKCVICPCNFVHMKT